jgi:hypothetical protein
VARKPGVLEVALLPFEPCEPGAIVQEKELAKSFFQRKNKNEFKNGA